MARNPISRTRSAPNPDELSIDDQVEEMVEWFHDHYEDPAQATSYNSREGGYLWDRGGPYDAREQLDDNFANIFSEDAIEKAVAEVEADGIYEWAGKRDDDGELDVDQAAEADDAESFIAAEDGGRILTRSGDPILARRPDAELDEIRPAELDRLGPGEKYLQTDDGRYLTDDQGRRIIAVGQDSADPAENARLQMLARIDELEAIVAQHAQLSAPAHRGHNNPPELLVVEPIISRAQIVEIVAAVAELRRESAVTAPSAENAVAQESIFRRVAKAVRGGIGFLASVAVAGVVEDAAVKAFNERQQLYDALIGAADAVATWVQHLPGAL